MRTSLFRKILRLTGESDNDNFDLRQYPQIWEKAIALNESFERVAQIGALITELCQQPDWVATAREYQQLVVELHSEISANNLNILFDKGAISISDLGTFPRIEFLVISKFNSEVQRGEHQNTLGSVLVRSIIEGISQIADLIGQPEWDLFTTTIEVMAENKEQDFKKAEKERVSQELFDVYMANLGKLAMLAQLLDSPTIEIDEFAKLCRLLSELQPVVESINAVIADSKASAPAAMSEIISVHLKPVAKTLRLIPDGLLNKGNIFRDILCQQVEANLANEQNLTQISRIIGESGIANPTYAHTIVTQIAQRLAPPEPEIVVIQPVASPEERKHEKRQRVEFEVRVSDNIPEQISGIIENIAAQLDKKNTLDDKFLTLQCAMITKKLQQSATHHVERENGRFAVTIVLPDRSIFIERAPRAPVTES